jgi:CubicO group peptidase (beta-lactamase class C family)
MTDRVSGAATDPVANGLMQGFPPPADKTLRLEDGSSWTFPNLRWAFSHQRELVPTANVWRGRGAAFEFPRALRDDLDAVAFTTMDGEAMTWGQSLDVNCTDGILVLHKGQVVYENYFAALERHIPHLAMSVTKSFVGVLAATLAHEGALDPHRLVPHYVPELAGTAYGDATVRHVMDMTIGVRYSETYTDPDAQIWAYTAASGVTARPQGYVGPETIFDFLRGLKKQGEHGQAFAYKTCNTEVLAWVVQRITGVPIAQLMSDRIWQKLGMEEDSYLLVDRIGTAMCGGGLNLTLRDLAKFGEMMRCDGAFNGRQVIPAAVVADTAGGADRDHFAKSGYVTLPGWSYRNQFWVSHDKFGAYSARGIHGQAAWIAPGAEVVIARFASHATAANGNGPLDRVSLPAYAAIAEHLVRT